MNFGKEIDNAQDKLEILAMAQRRQTALEAAKILSEHGKIDSESFCAIAEKILNQSGFKLE